MGALWWFLGTAAVPATDHPWYAQLDWVGLSTTIAALATVLLTYRGQGKSDEWFRGQLTRVYQKLEDSGDKADARIDRILLRFMDATERMSSGVQRVADEARRMRAEGGYYAVIDPDEPPTIQWPEDQ